MGGIEKEDGRQLAGLSLGVMSLIVSFQNSPFEVLNPSTSECDLIDRQSLTYDGSTYDFSTLLWYESNTHSVETGV